MYLGLFYTFSHTTGSQFNKLYSPGSYSEQTRASLKKNDFCFRYYYDLLSAVLNYYNHFSEVKRNFYLSYNEDELVVMNGPKRSKVTVRTGVQMSNIVYMLKALEDVQQVMDFLDQHGVPTIVEAVGVYEAIKCEERDESDAFDCEITT